MVKRSEDVWALGSGLPDDIDVTFGEAYFAFNSDYNDGKTLCLHIPYECDDPEVDTEKPLLFACGDGWEDADKGNRAVDEKGNEDRTFSGVSGMGLLITHAIEAGAQDTLLERGGDDGPYVASIWNGLRFHMKRIEHGKGQYKSERLYPTEFLGEEEGGRKPAASTKSAAKSTGTKTSTKPAAKTETKAEDGGLTTKLKIQLRDIARKTKKADGNHEQFVEAVYEELGTDLAAEVEAAVLDEDEDGIFASA